MTAPKVIAWGLSGLLLFSGGNLSAGVPAKTSSLLAVGHLGFLGLTTSPGFWISPELGLGEKKTITAALEEPLGDTFEVVVGALPHRVSKMLRTCVDYLEAEKSGYDAGPAIVSNVLHAQGARCVALDMLRSAHPATRSNLLEFSFKRISAKELPPGLALILAKEEERKAERLALRGGSILGMDRTIVLRPEGNNRARLVARDWTADFTLYARADFLGRGDEQLLLRRDAAVKEGSYRSTLLYLLSRPSSSVPFRIEKVRS